MKNGVSNLEKLYSYLCMLSINWPEGFYRTHNQVKRDISISRNTLYRLTKKMVADGVIITWHDSYQKRWFKVNHSWVTDEPLMGQQIYISIYRQYFLSENTRSDSPSGKAEDLRSKVKRKKRDWVPYILEHWNSKGKPLTKHKTGTALYKEIEHRINMKLKLYNRGEICKRIDTYFWLLTETALHNRVRHNTPGLVVNLAEFFQFRPEVQGHKSFTFNFDSWFDEVGTPGLVKRHSPGSPGIADKIGEHFKRHIGFKANQVQLMKASKHLITVAVKFKGKLKGVNLIEELMGVIRRSDPYSAGIVCQPFIYDELETVLKKKAKKPPARMLRVLQRSHEIPYYVSDFERRLNATKKNAKTAGS